MSIGQGRRFCPWGFFRSRARTGGGAAQELRALGPLRNRRVLRALRALRVSSKRFYCFDCRISGAFPVRIPESPPNGPRSSQAYGDHPARGAARHARRPDGRSQSSRLAVVCGLRPQPVCSWAGCARHARVLLRAQGAKRRSTPPPTHPFKSKPNLRAAPRPRAWPSSPRARNASARGRVAGKEEQGDTRNATRPRAWLSSLGARHACAPGPFAGHREQGDTRNACYPHASMILPDPAKRPSGASPASATGRAARSAASSEPPRRAVLTYLLLPVRAFIRYNLSFPCVSRVSPVCLYKFFSQIFRVFRVKKTLYSYLVCCFNRRRNTGRRRAVLLSLRFYLHPLEMKARTL